MGPPEAPIQPAPQAQDDGHLQFLPEAMYTIRSPSPLPGSLAPIIVVQTVIAASCPSLKYPETSIVDTYLVQDIADAALHHQSMLPDSHISGAVFAVPPAR